MARKSFKWGDVCGVGKWMVTRLTDWGAELEYGRTSIELKLENDISEHAVEPATMRWIAEPEYRRPRTKEEWAVFCEKWNAENDDYKLNPDAPSKDRNKSTFRTPPEVKAEAEHVMRWLCENRPAVVCSQLEKAASEGLNAEWIVPPEEQERLRALMTEWGAMCDKHLGCEPLHDVPEVEVCIEGQPCTLSARGIDVCFSTVVGKRTVTVYGPNGREEREEDETFPVYFKLDEDGRPECTEDVDRAMARLEQLGRLPAKFPLFAIVSDEAHRYAKEHGPHIVENRAIENRNRERWDAEFGIDVDRSKDYVRPKGGFRKAG